MSRVPESSLPPTRVTPTRVPDSFESFTLGEGQGRGGTHVLYAVLVGEIPLTTCPRVDGALFPAGVIADGQ